MKNTFALLAFSFIAITIFGGDSALAADAAEGAAAGMQHRPDLLDGQISIYSSISDSNAPASQIRVSKMSTDFFDNVQHPDHPGNA